MRARAVASSILALVVTGACGQTLPRSGEPDGVVDGGAAGEGGSEGGSPDASEGDTFCAQHRDAARCFDFDGPEDATAGWTETRVTGNGAVTKDSSDVLSSPSALLATAPTTGDAAAHVKLTGEIWKAPSFVVELDVKVDERPTTGTGLVLEVGQGDTVLLLYSEGAGEDFIQEFDGTKLVQLGKVPLTDRFSTGAWQHVRLEIDVDAATAVARVRLGTGKTVDLPLNGAWQSGVTTTVGIGLGFIVQPQPPPGSGRWRFRYDNVIVGAP